MMMLPCDFTLNTRTHAARVLRGAASASCCHMRVSATVYGEVHAQLLRSRPVCVCTCTARSRCGCSTRAYMYIVHSKMYIVHTDAAYLHLRRACSMCKVRTYSYQTHSAASCVVRPHSGLPAAAVQPLPCRADDAGHTRACTNLYRTGVARAPTNMYLRGHQSPGAHLNRRETHGPSYGKMLS